MLARWPFGENFWGRSVTEFLESKKKKKQCISKLTRKLRQQTNRCNLSGVTKGTNRTLLSRSSTNLFFFIIIIIFFLSFFLSLECLRRKGKRPLASRGSNWIYYNAASHLFTTTPTIVLASQPFSPRFFHVRWIRRFEISSAFQRTIIFRFAWRGMKIKNKSFLCIYLCIFFSFFYSIRSS